MVCELISTWYVHVLICVHARTAFIFDTGSLTEGQAH